MDSFATLCMTICGRAFTHIVELSELSRKRHMPLVIEPSASEYQHSILPVFKSAETFGRVLLKKSCTSIEDHCVLTDLRDSLKDLSKNIIRHRLREVYPRHLCPDCFLDRSYPDESICRFRSVRHDSGDSSLEDFLVVFFSRTIFQSTIVQHA